MNGPKKTPTSHDTPSLWFEVDPRRIEVYHPKRPGAVFVRQARVRIGPARPHP